MHIPDNDMPEGFHLIKCCLLTEINCATTFDLCMQAADALMHARRIGESISKERKSRCLPNNNMGPVNIEVSGKKGER